MTDAQKYVYDYLLEEKNRLIDEDAEEGLYEHEEAAFCLICKIMRMLQENKIENDRESMTQDYVEALQQNN